MLLSTTHLLFVKLLQRCNVVFSNIPGLVPDFFNSNSIGLGFFSISDVLIFVNVCSLNKWLYVLSNCNT